MGIAIFINALFCVKNIHECYVFYRAAKYSHAIVAAASAGVFFGVLIGIAIYTLSKL